MKTEKRMYVRPEVTVYGTLRELTQETKHKGWGGADDVLLDNEAVLRDVGS